MIEYKLIVITLFLKKIFFFLISTHTNSVIRHLSIYEVLTLK